MHGHQQEADRRYVTVLFADLSGFTSLSERVDPERLRSFQKALFEMLSQSVTRYGGFVAKFLGDAALALFGAPIAHEDDPERALAAALDMLTHSEELSADWTERLGQRVSLHIAVHTGPVVAGSFSDIAGGAYDVTGDTVNTASRLLGAAAPGTILISEATALLTRPRFAREPAGKIAMRGKAEPLSVYRLLGALAQPQSARGLAAHGLSSPFVGRIEELNQLVAAFHGMRRGRAQLVKLVGEAGTGKSRLIAEFLDRLEREGLLASTTVRRVVCSSLGEPPLGAFSALFREGYQMGASDSIGVARQKLKAGLRSLGAPPNVEEAIVPVLSFLLGVDEAHPREFDPEQLKRQIALAARMLVQQRLEQRPVLIVAEDLQWADTASIELLGDALEHFRDRPLMLLVSLRPGGQTPIVRQVAESTIALPPLSQLETRALVAGLFGQMGEDAVAQVQQLVETRAEGNPLFIEEIVRSLVDAGVIVRRGDRWTCEIGVHQLSIPPTLHGLLLSRVDTLPAAPKRLLQVAAVLGVAFEEMLLDAVAKGDGQNKSALEHLLNADVIQVAQAADGQFYKFTHALMREAVYENLLLSRRSELHERAGRALESIVSPNPSRLSDLEALGHHWSLSSDKSKGAGYLMAAGDRARAVYANADAIRHYEHALRTLAELRAVDGQLETVREQLAEVLALTGKRPDALAHYESALQTLEGRGDRAGCARLLRKIGVLRWEAGDRAQAKVLFESGLEQLEEAHNPIERAQLLQEIGRFAFRAGDNERAIDWAQRALAEISDELSTDDDLERSRDLAVIQAQAYNTLGVALARTGRLKEAVERIEQSIALAESHDLLQATCRGYTNLGVLYSSLDPRRSIETCRRGIEVAKRVGDLGYQSQLYANLAVAYCALTDRCEAEGVEAANIAIDLDRRLGLLDHLAVPLIVLGQIHQCHGDQSLAQASYQEALRLAERIGEPQLLFPCYDGLATLSLDAGNMSMAEMYFSKAREVCERAGVEPDELLMLPFLS